MGKIKKMGSESIKDVYYAIDKRYWVDDEMDNTVQTIGNAVEHLKEAIDRDDVGEMKFAFEFIKEQADKGLDKLTRYPDNPPKMMESAKKSKVKKSIPKDIDRQLDSMLEELADLCYNLDDRWVNTAVDAQYELGYRAYDDIRVDIKEILNGSNEGKIIGLCEDILQRMDSLGKVKKSIPESNNTKMSFTDNVNKMRVNNYAKIGNINTVMKKRD